ncbi:hypothetical protein [Mycobacteroides abscessus]|uniref:hypothetical protein n=1 Tax=Mycobacteroides abscessus TaxID=36809 RepID=UPI0012FFEC51|nr:hypothetical protein [Mycobacteroides abscessus]
MTLDIDALTKDIKKVAKNVEFQWPGLITKDDAEQEIWVHIMESPKTSDDLEAMDSDSRYRTIHKIGHRIASDYRADYDHFTGNFRYSVDEVKKLLESGAMEVVEHSIASGWSDSEFVSGGTEFEDKVLLTVSQETDLKNGLEVLRAESQQYYEILSRKYLLGENVTQTGAEHTRLSRAYSALATAMNSSHKVQHADRQDGPGTRRLVRRDYARHISKGGYDNDGPVAPAYMRDNSTEKEVWE